MAIPAGSAWRPIGRVRTATSSKGARFAAAVCARWFSNHLLNRQERRIALLAVDRQAYSRIGSAGDVVTETELYDVHSHPAGRRKCAHRGESDIADLHGDRVYDRERLTARNREAFRTRAIGRTEAGAEQRQELAFPGGRIHRDRRAILMRHHSQVLSLDCLRENAR